MHEEFSPTSVARRQNERLRKRRYRAMKKSEAQALQSQLERFQAQLQAITNTNKQPWQTTAAAMLHDRLHVYNQNKSLRDQLHRQYVLAKMLSSWVASCTVPQSLPSGASWQQSTLLADPVARRYGYEWLSNKLFHMATSSQNYSPFGGRVDDDSILTLHTQDDNISAIETHVQSTLLHNSMDVADAMWHEHVRDTVNDIVRRQVVEVVDGNIAYQRVDNLRLGTSLCTVLRMYHSPARSVITYTFVTEDETHPLLESELRVHGYGWHLFEHVADGVTLMRESNFQFAPVTTHGVVSLAENGRIFGQSTQGIEFPTAYIARIQTAAEANFRTVKQRTAKRVGPAIAAHLARQPGERGAMATPLSRLPSQL